MINSSYIFQIKKKSNCTQTLSKIGALISFPKTKHTILLAKTLLKQDITLLIILFNSNGVDEQQVMIWFMSNTNMYVHLCLYTYFIK